MEFEIAVDFSGLMKLPNEPPSSIDITIDTFQRWINICIDNNFVHIIELIGKNSWFEYQMKQRFAERLNDLSPEILKYAYEYHRKYYITEECMKWQFYKIYNMKDFYNMMISAL